MHPGEGYASIDGRAWETLLFYAWIQRSSDCSTCLIRRASRLRKHAKQVFASGSSPGEYNGTDKDGTDQDGTEQDGTEQDGACIGAQQPVEVGVVEPNQRFEQSSNAVGAKG